GRPRPARSARVRPTAFPNSGRPTREVGSAPRGLTAPGPANSISEHAHSGPRGGPRRLPSLAVPSVARVLGMRYLGARSATEPDERPATKPRPARRPAPPMLSIDLTGKRAFVAGVADDRGYGWAICKALA